MLHRLRSSIRFQEETPGTVWDTEAASEEEPSQCRGNFLSNMTHGTCGEQARQGNILLCLEREEFQRNDY